MIEEHDDAIERLLVLQRGRVNYQVAEARSVCRTTMATLQTHLLLHGCGRYDVKQAAPRPSTLSA
ncbi:MAG TPA: hypothetical protein VFK87_04305 [Steroidobacteraceae bacterium]|nr:hypothetical protein [Steroidobacteraceae bacterium]